MVTVVRFLSKVFLVLITASIVYAAPDSSISGLTSFSPRTTISSSEMNGNFNSVSNTYNGHSHTDISQVGTITSGSWAGTAIPVKYGGTGEDFSSSASASIIYFDGTGSMATLAPGTSTQILSINSGGTAVEWIDSIAGARHGISRGFEISATGATVTINSGTLYHDTSYVNVATNTTLTLTTAGDYSSGSVVTYAGAAGWNYIGVTSSASKTNKGVYLLGELYPQYSDVDGNTDGTKLYTKIGTTYYRVIGAIRQTTGNSTAYSFYQTGNDIVYNNPAGDTSAGSGLSDTSFTDLDLSALVPSISTRVSMMSLTAGGSCAVFFRANGGGGVGYSTDTQAGAGYYLLVENVPTDASQVVEYKVSANSITAYVKGFKLNIR